MAESNETAGIDTVYSDPTSATRALYICVRSEDESVAPDGRGTTIVTFFAAEIGTGDSDTMAALVRAVVG